MKFCYNCKETKNTEDFYISKTRKDKKESLCKKCRNKKSVKYGKSITGKEIRKKATAKWRLANKEAIKNYQTIRRSENKNKAVLYLGGKCKQCQIQFQNCVYDFHHRDPKEKEFSPATIFNKSWETIKKEIDKCDLLCANCHRLIHHGEINDNYSS